MRPEVLCFEFTLVKKVNSRIVSVIQIIKISLSLLLYNIIYSWICLPSSYINFMDFIYALFLWPGLINL